MKASSTIGNITQIAVRNHADLQGLTTDNHHAEIVLLAKCGAGACRITSGSYVGADAVNTARAHNLGRTPAIIFFGQATDVGGGQLVTGANVITCAQNHTFLGVSAPDATNFYVGNATSYPYSMNSATRTYFWVAIG